MAVQAKAQSGREHEVGVLAAPLLKFNLEQEIRQLKLEGRWQSGHTAKTLAKYPDFRIVLVVMNTGGKLVQHRTEGRISVHALSGQINFRTPEQSIELSAGEMLTLERDIVHDVESATDSAFLLTIAWPQSSPIAAEGLTKEKQTRSETTSRNAQLAPLPVDKPYREKGLDKTLADTFPCSDALSTIPNPKLAAVAL
ncbi:MAG TPA: hypothetical protein VJN64_08390 [Terriglobales bacterium]|nr:hypothetical protein [Terriglobales bacterium]